jgi:hypothetical protein
LDQIGVTRGICVVLGDGACERALNLVRDSELLIYLQLPSAEDVRTACETADKAGLYGNRIFVEKGSLARLHLANNLADALIAAGQAANVSQAEALRVMRPGGKALLGSKVLTKPSQRGVDDWSHPYHGPDNNPQSLDSVIVAPYLTQFMAEPRYAPLPQVTVTSDGRVFKAFGHVAFKEREEPFLNKLVLQWIQRNDVWRRGPLRGVIIHAIRWLAPAFISATINHKIIDTVTGELKGKIPPVDIAGGTF